MSVCIGKHIVNTGLGTIHRFRYPLGAVKHPSWMRKDCYGTGVEETSSGYYSVSPTSVLTQAFLGAVSMMLAPQFWALLKPEWGMSEVGDSGNSPLVQWYFKFRSSSPILLPLFIFQSPQIVACAFFSSFMAIFKRRERVAYT